MAKGSAVWYRIEVLSLRPSNTKVQGSRDPLPGLCASLYNPYPPDHFDLFPYRKVIGILVIGIKFFRVSPIQPVPAGHTAMVIVDRANRMADVVRDLSEQSAQTNKRNSRRLSRLILIRRRIPCSRPAWFKSVELSIDLASLLSKINAVGYRHSRSVAVRDHTSL